MSPLRVPLLSGLALLGIISLLLPFLLGPEPLRLQPTPSHPDCSTAAHPLPTGSWEWKTVYACEACPTQPPLKTSLAFWGGSG